MSGIAKVLAQELRPDGERITAEDIIHSNHLRYGCPAGAECQSNHALWRHELEARTNAVREAARQGHDDPGSK